MLVSSYSMTALIVLYCPLTVPAPSSGVPAITAGVPLTDVATNRSSMSKSAPKRRQRISSMLRCICFTAWSS